MKTWKYAICLIYLYFQWQVAEAQHQGLPDSLKLINHFNSQTKKWQEAYNSGDATNLIALYASNARYVSGHVEGLVANGRENLISNFQRGMSGGGHIDNIEIISMEYSCEMVSLFCKYQATNSGTTVNGRNVLILKKIAGEWKIILHITVV